MKSNARLWSTGALRSVASVAITILILPLSGELRAQTVPPWGTCAAYDEARNQMVFFGGRPNNPSASTGLAETWLWDGNSFMQRSPATNPPATQFLSMTYDVKRQRTVLVLQGDIGNRTWVWDGTNWMGIIPPDSPSNRLRTTIAYDKQRERVVLFGGVSTSLVLLNDTWEWDGSTWTEMHPANSPSARESHAMVYDEARQEIVMFGGRWPTGTWVWDGINWVDRAPTNSPTPRGFHAMAYDPNRQRVVLFGGETQATPSNVSDTWEWDGTNWTQVFPDIVPQGRQLITSAFDPHTASVLIVGGGDLSVYNDAWFFNGQNWKNYGYPRVQSRTPSTPDGGGIPAGFNQLTLQLNKQVDLSSFTNNFSLDGQMGHRPVAITYLTNRYYRIDFSPLTEEGPYHFTILRTLLDTDGLQLDQNANGVPGETNDDYSFTLNIDTTPPRVTQHAPAGDVSGAITNVDVWFSERLDKSTFTTGDVSIFDPTNGPVPLMAIQEVGLNRFRISFPAQTSLGTYHVFIGTNIADMAGNALKFSTNTLPPGVAYDASFNLRPVDLELANLAVSTNQLWAGDPVSVSWETRNAFGVPVAGGWNDAIYLSGDAQWDITDILLATVPHNDPTASNGVYTASTTFNVPGVLPGNYYLLVRADLGNDIRETVETNNASALGPIAATVRAFPLGGGSFAGLLTPNAPSAYYAITIAAGQNLFLHLLGHSTNGAATIYVSAGGIPTPLQYEQRAPDSGLDLRFALANSSTNDQTYHVLVRGDQIDGSLPFDVTSQIGALFISGISPNRHGNISSATVTLTGAGFDDTTTVNFVSTNGTILPADAIELVSPVTLRLLLQMTNWPAGLYTVRAVKGAATNELTNAFEVVQGGIPHLTTRLIVPDAVGFAIPIRQTLWIEYHNDGEIPMPAPLLVLRGDNGARLTPDAALAIPRRGFGQIPGVSDTAQVLGLGSSSTPWILQPGESGRVPVYYIGLSQTASYPQVTFTLSRVTADDARPIDWAAVESTIRPTGIGNQLWSSQFSSIQTTFGTTWGDYVATLGQGVAMRFSANNSPVDANSVRAAFTSVSSVLGWLAILFGDFDRSPNHVEFLDIFKPGDPTDCTQCAQLGLTASSAMDAQDSAFAQVEQSEKILDDLVWQTSSLVALETARAAGVAAQTYLLYVQLRALLVGGQAVGLTGTAWVSALDDAKTFLEKAKDAKDVITIAQSANSEATFQTSVNDAAQGFTFLVQLNNSVYNKVAATVAGLPKTHPGYGIALDALKLALDVDKLATEGVWPQSRTALTALHNAKQNFDTKVSFYADKVTLANQAKDAYRTCIEQCSATASGPPGFTVSPTSGLMTTEDGGQASFTVRLSGRPTALVAVNVSSSDSSEGVPSNSSLVWSVDTWSLPRTVVVTGVDDAVDDGNVGYQIVLSPATSADPGYNGLDPQDVSLVNRDNDGSTNRLPGVTVNPTSGLTSEDGKTDTFSIVLNSAPTADVSIGLSSSDTGEGGASTTGVTFTPGNWNTAQNVTVTGADDADCDGNANYSIITSPASSGDPNYNGINPADISLVNNDNETNCCYTCQCDPSLCPPPPPPPPCVGNCGGNNSTVVGSFDPNDKLGPVGFGPSAFVSGQQPLAYVVRFENKSDASAPARQVVVTDTFDAGLDLSTLQLTEIAFANRIIPIPSGLNAYAAQVPMTVTNGASTNNIVVNVQAALNATNRTLTLTLSALDPNTGWFPEDPLVGLLYPDDDTGRGIGSISYLIKPVVGLPTGTRIENRARIVFDYNDPIDTPQVANTLDSDLPLSSVATLPATVTNSSFVVSWSGADVGSGLASYDVYVSTNSTSWTPWLQNTDSTSAVFQGQDNRTYHFYSIARDNVGNFEAAPVAADATTATPTNSAPTLDPIADQSVDANSVLVVTNRADDFLLPGQRLNFALVFAPVGARIENTASNEARFVWIPACEQGGTTNLVTIQVSDNGTPPLTASQTFVVTVPDCVQVKLGNTVARAGDSVSLSLELLSTVQLSNVLMTGTYPAQRFTDLTLLISTQQVETVAFFDLPGADMMALGLNMQTNHTLRTNTEIATVGMRAFSNQSSAFIWNTLPGVEAYRLDGSMVTNAYGLAGRIVVVGEEPLLEALRAPSNQVALLQYAPTGSTMTIEWSTNVFSGNWQQLIQNTQSNLVQETGNILPNQPMLFFQAVRGTN